jgi:hypothetical protein
MGTGTHRLARFINPFPFNTGIIELVTFPRLITNPSLFAVFGNDVLSVSVFPHRFSTDSRLPSPPGLFPMLENAIRESTA